MLKILKSLFVVSTILSFSAQASIISIGTFTGGDEGEGLDFIGNFEYAVNARGPGGAVIGDATFTDDSGIINATREILNWGSVNNYGATANDNALESIMRSIRWSVRGQTFDITMTDLTVGNDYSLQLLFGEKCCNRGFDIFADGQLIWDDFSANGLQGSQGSTTLGAFLRYGFTAESSTLTISLGGRDFTRPDNNPILNAFTLENVTQVPEPSSLALLALSVFGLVRGRSKK